MKRLLMLGLALALIVPATAAAKGEIDTGSVAICGPSDCGPFDDEASLRWLSGLMYAESPSAAPRRSSEARSTRIREAFGRRRGSPRT